MIELAKFFSVSYGITAIIVHSYIFDSLRFKAFKALKEPWNKFLLCPMCVGFWVGMFCYLMGLDVCGNPFWAACASSGLCYYASIVRSPGGCKGCGKK